MTTILKWWLVWVAIATQANGEWLSMFDGKSLDGWQPCGEGNTFRVEDGVLRACGQPGRLNFTGAGSGPTFYRHFKFECEARTTGGGEARVLFHLLPDDEHAAAAGVLPICNREDGSACPRTGSLLGKHHVYRPLAADGEWTRMFSKEVIAKFDYVFTDGMTLTLPDGTRSRLWIPEEVKIGDKQEFMECLVATIVRILDEEPIDIYVNPLYLPDVLQPEAVELWTPARLRRVLDALARNRVALELSNRYGFVTPQFVREAKVAGIKFTIGTNNADGNFGREDQALRLIRECGLTAGDMWLPKPDGQKPVQVKARNAASAGGDAGETGD